MHRFENLRVAMPTLHGKEKIISQAFSAWQWEVVALPVDTNRLGTFTGEVERPADPLATAWMKLEAGLPHAAGFDLLIASEGSFYPHPEVPLITLNTELLVLRDLRNNRQYQAAHTDYFPLSVREQVNHWQQLEDLAARLDFPQQGLILPGVQEKSVARQYLKDLHDMDALRQGFEQLQKHGAAIWVETDFRALHAPLRQSHIAAAAGRLLEKLQCHCPACEEPGFGKTAPLSGLPCSWCGTPTRLTRSWMHRCEVCHHEVEMAVAETAADPGYCDRCNP